MTSENIDLNTDGSEALLGLNSFNAAGDMTKNCFKKWHIADKSLVVESYKHGIASALKAI